MPSVASPASQSRNSRARAHGQTVADDSGQMLQMFDRLASRLSISEQPERFQKLALTSLIETISAMTLAWVPAGPH